ncbi:TauD/TfdA family dioxygenase [Micromonospora endolithica]|uniref:Taurine catabolism dioxygenase TauD n=1 Tax=Micromonospora endolithica TaxID=230091 RepID=A0A3A9ZS64_9ACTN|nr:TauD/TfdA family dioxygenase [Micromonospora endolithica]RKN50436.1 taurine catabolism dioxygenase TauD [Micromonospora endolithica]TWJ20877.1 TfdA family taurine catabolism dioxygenase TauD [Micromonospora endolithica]
MPLTPAPTPLCALNAALWSGADLTTDDYTVALDEHHAAEVADATQAACRGLAGRDMTFDPHVYRDDFPLPSVGPVLAEAAREVADGRGFAVVRGLPLDGMDDQQAAVMVRGLITHLGPIATQSRDRHLIRHVRSTGQPLGDAVTRGHQTAERLWFHTDGADAAVLLCRRAAAVGGLSRLASAAAVHNTMLLRDPAAVTALYEPFHFHMAGGNVPGLPATFISPIFSLYRGKFSTRFVRHTLLETQQVTGVALPEVTLTAFDLIEDIADRLCVDMELRAGDLQIVNNHKLLHSRTAYTDPDDAEQARHLLRCWLTFPHYTGRRAGFVDEALRFGWLTDEQQREAAGSWTPPTPVRVNDRG